MPRSLVPASIFLSLALPALSVAAPFTTGELLLVTNAAPTVNAAILRVAPLTGAVTLLYDAPASQSVQNSAAWDPFRSRVVYSARGAGEALYGVDSDGVATVLLPGTPSPDAVASRGDGKLYLWNFSPEGFRYLDAANVVHDLLDVTGTVKFGLGQNKVLQQILYHPGTNSLIGVVGSLGGSSSPCADASQVCAIRIPLNAAGTQVAGPVTGVNFDVSTSFELCVGLSHGPSGSVLITVDTNSNAREPRMLRLDPATMAISVFAQNGSYTGAAATNAGCYSHVLGRAVVLDTFADSLRAFSLGEVGLGTHIAGGVSTFGTNEIAQLVEVDSSGVATIGVEAGAAPAHAARWLAGAPNPFRDRVVLRYVTRADEAVAIEIRDLAGRRVRAFAAAPGGAGERTLEWDGRDEAGSAVRPGVYFADLVTRAGRDRRALVRLR